MMGGGLMLGLAPGADRVEVGVDLPPSQSGEGSQGGGINPTPP